MFSHFDVLMGFDLQTRSDLFFGSKGLTVFNYAETHGNNSLKLLTSKLRIRSALLKSDVPRAVGSVLLLPGLFKEEPCLFKTFKVTLLMFFYCATIETGSRVVIFPATLVANRVIATRF
jgi:hypothetical protein